MLLGDGPLAVRRVRGVTVGRRQRERGLGDPRCVDALALLESKRLPDGGFPLEAPNARVADRVASRHSYAEWGPSGRRRSNPLVSLAALDVLKAGALRGG